MKKNMMESSFSFISILEIVEQEPVYMVLWAAFGFFFGSLVLFIPIIILRKATKTVKVEKGVGLAVTILMLCWVMGFVTQMVLFFSDVPGIKLFFIWISMVFTYVVFGMFNKKMILKWSNTITKTNT